jgi:hypothetical protein
VATRLPRALLGLLLAAVLCTMLSPAAGAQQTDSADGLVPYATPSAGTIRVDARLVPGLDVLGQLELGRPLVDALARGGVTVVLAAEPPGVWAHYDPGARTVTVDRSFWGADPRTLATLLSHEATHVQNHQDGGLVVQMRASGAASECYTDEYQATVTELRVWQELFGPRGKGPAEHAYEREQNRELARYLGAPDGYWARLVADYAPVCGQ